MVFAATWIAASLQMMKVVGALAGEPMSPRQYSSGLWLTSGKTRASGPGLSVETYTWSPKASVAALADQGMIPVSAMSKVTIAGANPPGTASLLLPVNTDYRAANLVKTPGFHQTI